MTEWCCARLGRELMEDEAMDYRMIMDEARDAASAVTGTQPVCGCGRVYVELLGTISPKLRSAIKGVGYSMTERPGSPNKKRIYVGYDNATGREWAQGEAIARVLTSHGIRCYVDGDSD